MKRLLRAGLALFLSALPRLDAEAVRIEDGETCGVAQFVQWDGICGFLTPAHVFDALRRPFRLQGKPFRCLVLRRFPGRDLVFFAGDAAGEAPLKLLMRTAPQGSSEFRLPGPREWAPDDWRGRSGTLEFDSEGRPGLFIGLDRVTHERVFVRIDDLPEKS